MTQWQILLIIILLSSMLKSPDYQTAIMSFKDWGDLNENERKLRVGKTVSFFIALAIAWFVAGWIQPFLGA